MKPKPFEVVAGLFELGAGFAFRNECKMFASHNFRELPHRLVGVYLAISTHEQLVVYQ